MNPDDTYINPGKHSNCEGEFGYTCMFCGLMVEEPNPLCVHPIYQAYRSQDYYLGPPSQASATTSSSDHYFADQDAGNSSDYGMFVDSPQPSRGTGFLDPGLLAAPLQEMHINNSSTPEYSPPDAEPRDHPTIFPEIDIIHNVTPVEAETMKNPSDPANPVYASPPRRALNGKRAVTRSGDPKPPDEFNTLDKDKNEFGFYNCFNDCRKKHVGRGGFGRRGNLFAHLRRYHGQNIPKGGF